MLGGITVEEIMQRTTKAMVHSTLLAAILVGNLWTQAHAITIDFHSGAVTGSAPGGIAQYVEAGLTADAINAPGPLLPT